MSHLPLTTRLTTAAVCAVALPALLATAVPAAGVGNGRRLTTSLTGAAERPGPGDPDGSGTARLRVNPGTGVNCYDLAVRGIEPANAAHIHEGSRDVAEPVVLALAAPTGGPRRRSHPGVGGRHGDGVPLPENRFALTSSAGTRHWLGSRC